MRKLIALMIVAVVVAACGAPRTGPGGGGEKLYEAVGQSILVIDSKSHAIERRLPLGVPSTGWQHLYSMLGDSLVDTNPVTGQMQNTLALGAQYQLPLATHAGLPGGLSPAGKWLVLEAYDGSATHMVVVNTGTFTVADSFDLAGRFTFDAISDDGLRLYLIQYLYGKEYYVRLFDIPGNHLDANIVVDKSDGNQAMAGVRLSGIANPKGSLLLSMYVRENESPFVHALNLTGPFAFCLDLPGDGYAISKTAMQWALAMNRDGSRLYAVNGAAGVVAELDSSQDFSPQVLRMAHFSAGPSVGGGGDAAVLSADGKTLFTASGSGVVWLDTSSLEVRRQSLTGWQVWGMGLSPDGDSLYVVSDAGKVAEVSMASGAVIGRFDPGAGKPIALMRVAAS